MAEPEVTVQFVGQMRRPAGVGDETRVAWQEGWTVDDVLAALGYHPPERRMLRVPVSDLLVHVCGAQQPLLFKRRGLQL